MRSARRRNSRTAPTGRSSDEERKCRGAYVACAVGPRKTFIILLTYGRSAPSRLRRGTRRARHTAPGARLQSAPRAPIRGSGQWVSPPSAYIALTRHAHEQQTSSGHTIGRSDPGRERARQRAAPRVPEAAALIRPSLGLAVRGRQPAPTLPPPASLRTQPAMPMPMPMPALASEAASPRLAT